MNGEDEYLSMCSAEVAVCKTWKCQCDIHLSNEPVTYRARQPAEKTQVFRFVCSLVKELKRVISFSWKGEDPAPAYKLTCHTGL